MYNAYYMERVFRPSRAATNWRQISSTIVHRCSKKERMSHQWGCHIQAFVGALEIDKHQEHLLWSTERLFTHANGEQ